MSCTVKFYFFCFLSKYDIRNKLHKKYSILPYIRFPRLFFHVVRFCRTRCRVLFRKKSRFPFVFSPARATLYRALTTNAAQRLNATGASAQRKADIMEEAIREKLEELRGMLQADGGDLEVVSITGKTVLLRLRGACGACPHAQMTLKDGIERILRESVDPEIVVERA